MLPDGEWKNRTPGSACAVGLSGATSRADDTTATLRPATTCPTIAPFDVRSELRKPDHLDEELVDLADRAHELVHVDGLGHVGVGVQLVALEDVLLGRRRRQHDDRDVA